MRKILSLFFALLMASMMQAKVAFLVPADNTNKESMRYETVVYYEGENRITGEEQSPERRAWQWFNDNFVTSGDGQFICFNDLNDIPSDIHAIWIYVDRVEFSAGDFDNLFNATVKANLQTFLNAGGNLFLCKQATRLEKDLVGATDGQSSTPGDGNVITPAYNDGLYYATATWGVDLKFEFDGKTIGNRGHAIYKDVRHIDDNYSELIWTSDRRHTDNNCGFEIGWMGMDGVKDKARFHNFETRNNCKVLGGWANGDGCHYGGVIEFYPTGSRKGTVMMIGLAAYFWGNYNGGWGFEDTEDITRNALNYLNARPCAGDNTTPMEDKLANDSFFYPSNTTTFRTLHPVCEDMAAAYSIASDPNGIARIHEGKLQFKAAGTVTLHITLTENREFKNWPKGAYEYDREITFAYADPQAAQKAVNEDFPGTGVISEGEPPVQMAMLLHPFVRDMDSVSYTITNHYNETEGEAYKKTEDGVTRLYFSKSGKVLLNIRLNEPNEYREEWPAGIKDLTRVVEFTYTQEEGPTFLWPAIFFAEAVPAKSVIDLPETVEGLTVTYSIEEGDDATLEGHTLTLDDKASGHVTVHASVTEDKILVTWPVGTYNYEKSLNFEKLRPKSNGENPIPMEEKLAEDFFYPSNTTTFRTLHPDCEGLSAVYSITSDPDAIARIEGNQLQFKAAGTVTLHIVLTESRGDRLWEDGDYEYDREITFAYADAQAAQDGPNFTWPSQFETGAVGPNSVITLPATVAELPVSYEVIGDASLEGNEMTLANVESGSVTVNASVTETGYHEAWPAGVYNYQNSLAFHAAEVGYLLPAAESIDHLKFSDDPDYQGQQPEYNAAKWFQDNYIATGQGRFVTVDELPTLKAKGIKALWVNIERVNIDNVNGLLTACLADDGLKTYIQAGGNVLLTKQATRLAYTMGRIGYAPEFNAGGYVTDNFGAQRSVATRMGISADEVLDMSEHRLFTDMLSWTDSKNVYLVGETCKKTYNYCSWENFFKDNQGAYAYGNGNIQRLRDFETAWNATVFGIRGDIVDYCLSNIIEFNATGNWLGRILTIGSAAYQWGSANPTAELDNVKKLTANSLSYLLDEPLADEVYTRNGLTPGIYGTICFDYAVETGHIEGAEIYELTSFNATNDGVILTQVDAMVAGRPYFFLATANELRLTYHGQRVAAGSYHGLVGHIGETTLHITPNDNNYILYNNELLLVNTDDIELPSYRAYINKYDEIPAYSEPTSSAPRRIMAIEPPHNAPTAVEAVDMQAAQGVYDIMGRKLSAPQGNGFYIINGQKVIITQ